MFGFWLNGFVFGYLCMLMFRLQRDGKQMSTVSPLYPYCTYPICS